jgi:hypothetical protein
LLDIIIYSGFGTNYDFILIGKPDFGRPTLLPRPDEFFLSFLLMPKSFRLLLKPYMLSKRLGGARIFLCGGVAWSAILKGPARSVLLSGSAACEILLIIIGAKFIFNLGTFGV